MRGLKDLRGYQRRTANFVFKNEASFLMIDMGLGKTVSVLTVFNALKYDYLSVFKALVIAPPQVALNTWPDEVKEWEHLQHLKVTPISGTAKQRVKKLQESTDIHTISVNLVPWLCEHFPGRLPYDWIIIDESSCFKSPTSKRFLYLKNKIARCRVSLLTGTPAPNGAHDLWAQVFLLDKGERLERTITAFRNKYCSAKAIPGTNARQYETNEEMDNLVMSKISDLTISLKSEDYLELPKCQFIDQYVTMDAGTLERYEEFKKEKVLELIESDEPLTAANANTLSIKLRQFANGFVYEKKIDEKNEKVINVAHKMHDLKIEALEEIVEAANGAPVIVAYTFKEDKERILKHFKKLKPVAMEQGEKGRDIVKRWNKKEIKMLVTHAASIGHGLNLQFGGHILIFFGLDWRLELYQQIIKRIHRSGQPNPFVLIYRILCRGTVDAKIKLSLENKASGQNAMIDFVKDNINEFRDSLQDR